jgi:pyruvate formate lyase activating enzyme
MNSYKINVFDIQRFSWHDGPGIRTVVFLKGCNMNCFWCHNPESLSFEKDLLFYRDKCVLCGKCVRVCPEGCHCFSPGGEHLIKRELCMKCGRCAEACYADALKIIGQKMTIDDVMKEVIKDMEFYEMSGGGITVSGGEPLLQAQGCYELLKMCKKNNIGTAIDTAGNVSLSSFNLVLPVTDYIIFDIKTLDEDKHREVCGVTNKKILENLRKLKNREVNILIKIPVIPGINDSRGEIDGIVDEVKNIINVAKIEILPFHKLAATKYRALGKRYEAEKLKQPEEEKIAELRKSIDSLQFCIDSK